MSVERGSQSEPSREPFELKGDAVFGDRENLKELRDNPDKIVRVEKFINNSTDDTISFYKNLKRLFESMRDNYGINIPDIDLVLGETKPGKKAVFMIVDKIRGASLDKLEKLPNDAKEKLEIFYENLLQSLLDAYKNREPFFSDVYSGNIMYGHVSKEESVDDKFFLFDVGEKRSFVYNKSDDEKINYDKRFFEMIFDVGFDIKDYESKFGEGVTLNKSRSKFKEIYDYCKLNKGQELNDYFAGKKRENLQERLEDEFKKSK